MMQSRNSGTGFFTPVCLLRYAAALLGGLPFDLLCPYKANDTYGFCGAGVAGLAGVGAIEGGLVPGLPEAAVPPMGLVLLLGVGIGTLPDGVGVGIGMLPDEVGVGIDDVAGPGTGPAAEDGVRVGLGIADGSSATLIRGIGPDDWSTTAGSTS